MIDNGFLYFLINSAMPGLVKIGYTTGDVKERVRQLNTTGIPSPFVVSAIFFVRDAKKCEAEVHKKLDRYRTNPNREFFSHTVSILVQESIDVIGRYIDSSPPLLLQPHVNDEENLFSPEDDDIYFMLYLLHDSYEENKPLSSTYLAMHHDSYAPLEVELRLMNLQTHGYVKRVNREHEGLGLWQILPVGVKFMFDGNYHAQDLIEESRNNH